MTTNHVRLRYRNCGSTITNVAGHAIATPTTLDELRALADQLYELVWLGYRRVETA